MRKFNFYSIFLTTLACSFLMDACHSSKNVTRSAGANTVEAGGSNVHVAATGNRENSVPEKDNAENKNANVEKTKDVEKTILTTYADKLGVSRRDITNYKLYRFINDWYGTPYKYAGHTKSGIDCSDFASLLLADVYNISITGAASAIYKQCKPIKRSELKEGDLVFFKINKRSLSHVGIYLQNHKFVHASVHAGVIIDDMNEDYYKRYFRAAGRILN